MNGTEINETMDRCERILQILEDTFDDERSEFAYKRYAEIVGDGTELNYQIAITYLEWCLANPTEIGKYKETVPCKCNAGWILDDIEEQRWRPCPRCLPGAYDLWMANFTMAPPGMDEDDDLEGWDGPSYEQQGF